MSQRSIVPAILIAGFISGLITTAHADIPKVINYQGKVTDTGGTPVADGTYSMRFRIYDAETAGNLEWDSGSVSVAVSGGVFEVMLGESPQPALGLAFDEDYWLETVVDSDVQSPRVKLASVGYAYMASGVVPGTLIEGSVTSGTSAAIRAVNTATTDVTYGVQGEAFSSRGCGVFGYASTTVGDNDISALGVYGLSSAPGRGIGVYGASTASSGFASGVVGESDSMEGAGVAGYAGAPSGTNYGVYGESDSSQGTGVFGTGETGVHGYSSAATGIGVFGHCDAASGITHGVYGWSTSASGRGVYGLSGSSSGTNYGVFGSAVSSSGYGIYGMNLAGGWAGGFDGDVDLDGRLVLPDNDATPSIGSGAIEIGSASRALRLDGNEIITNTGELLDIQKDNGGDLRVDEGTLYVDSSNDRVGIGTTSPGYELQVGTNGDGSEARANAWNLLSSKKYKTDIVPLEDGEYSEILTQLGQTEVVRYRFYQDANRTHHLGIIAEDAPRDIVTSDGEALSLSDYCAFLLAATKAQQEIIQSQQGEIEALKTAVRAMETR